VRVLDLSWVIAGPTTTRYLALMGADVVKVEAPGRPDTGRASELHDVLGQSKRAALIDLKAPGALEAVRRIVARSDVVVENYATGVMERLGLGYEALREVRDDIVLVSASGLGRTGPEAERVAYGNLLSAFAGFSRLNGHEGGWPRTGMAWADPLCGLLLAFGTVAALRRRDRGGGGCHLDFSMLEALLWTMPRALLAARGGEEPRPQGNDDDRFAPHGVYRCRGDDRWLAIAVTSDEEWQALCRTVPQLAAMAGLDEAARRLERPAIDAVLDQWALGRDAVEAMHHLQASGVAAAATMDTTDLFADAHLWERGFYRFVEEADGTERVLPGLGWRRGDGPLVRPRAAPGVGEHTAEVLAQWAGLDAVEIDALRSAGAFGGAAG
jgi:crotonobetainyl-CoA:carnitine CoA-transferase CaiB-like acyl-CoA transferase